MNAPAACKEEPTMSLTEFDRQLITATQSGLPLVPRPYAAVAEQLGVTEAAV